VIVLGNLKGIRRNGRGRAFNRKLNNGFPYHRLSQFIEYKARWHGIRVIKISERNTSKTCHRCKHRGLRVGSLFKCPNCGYICNADYNGAMNILKRAMGYMPIAGAALTQPLTRYGERFSLEEPRIPWLQPRRVSNQKMSTIILGKYCTKG